MPPLQEPAARAVYPSLRGRRALVTGGGSGIGAAIVAAFVAQGAEVVFFDVDEALSSALTAGLGERARFERIDLNDIDSTVEAISRLGPFDVLVNNAARDDRHALEDVTTAYWDDRLNVNLRHLFFCAQAVARTMRAAGGGAIVNMGSISWHLGLPEMPLYQTAKAAIEGLTRSLARDLGRDRIRVTCVIPGWVSTPRQERWETPEAIAKLYEEQTIPDRVLPEDVAALVLFLASDDARLCTGHNYWVDAGWM